MEEERQNSISDSDIENEIEEIYSQMTITKQNLIEKQQHEQKNIENSSQILTEYGTLSSSITEIDKNDNNNKDKNKALNTNLERENNKKRPKMNVEEQARLDTVTRFRSWLQETERDVAITVDIADQNIVRQALNKIHVS